MFEHFPGAAPLDLDDFDLPDPETEEDASEDPTAMASTAELLAAVAARVQANQSIGHVVLDAPQADGADAAPAVAEGAAIAEHTEPTLAHQPVVGLPAAGHAPQPATPPAEDAKSRVGGLLLSVAMVSALIGLAAFLATLLRA
ncbi:MAG: hypothetical protein D6798_20100 [Deltaproteobacteria bacterium]|nr:MAG: hypothetical protein D6798_20100 [Deltaproteobacteria bacterium]